MDNGERTVAAKCRTCGRNLTVTEFRECSGIGHYCKTHLPVGSVKTTHAPRRATKRVPGKSGGGRYRRVNESGIVEFPCKAQFAGSGVVHRGKLTSDHPSCMEGDIVFVCKDIAHGPSEIILLFIKDPDGRKRAERAGFDCRG
ncbi:MAG: hypothetical protein JXQ73_24330 [Phycisphaerae bacterium]|nr:hypothetical protein [Phycisphaerae bacterium]